MQRAHWMPTANTTKITELSPQRGHLLFNSLQLERLVSGLDFQIAAAGLHRGNSLSKFT